VAGAVRPGVRPRDLPGAWGAAVTAGHLAGGDVLLEICRTIRVLPPPPGAPGPLDLLLDGLALLITEGHAAATSTLQRATEALADIPVEDVLRWGWVATAASALTWDIEGMLAISTRQVQLVRDQRGIGLTDKPADGYDTGSQANDMVALMKALGHRRFAVYGTDTGMPIAYALAADHRDRVERLVVSEAVIAGVTPSPPLIVPTQQANDQLWHIPFNRVAEVNEQLVKGREDIYFSSRLHGLPADVVSYYVRILKSDRHALRGSFGQYRAFDATIVQNQQRMTRRLTLPVLAIGGAQGLGEAVIKTMELVADDPETLVIPDSGHWVAEEAPEELLAALTKFLAPYRDAPTAPRP
jgi:pimeloyl-ACP methyl ester carboxylesterase